MRVILGVLRIWSDQVMRSEYKALINEKCDAYLAAKHKTRMTRTVRGWFQAVVVRDVTIQVIRKKQMQGVKPTWFTWRLATVQLLQLKRISERISANTRCNLQSRAWRGWVSVIARILSHILYFEHVSSTFLLCSGSVLLYGHTFKT
jgi:hypothetical protein